MSSKPYTPQDKEKLFAAWLEIAKTDFLNFVGGLVIPHETGDVTWHNVLAPHQMEVFEAVAPNLEKLAVGKMPDARRYWIERTKKASKDTDLAAMCLWLIAFTERPLYVQIAASDKDQAAIVRRRMETFVHYNPWLENYVDVQTYAVRALNSGAKIDILAADVSGSHGETPDLLVCNELSHVSKWEFVENLLDNADGVPWGMVLIATNAGFKGTEAERWRMNAIESKDWETYFYDKPAPWHHQSTIDDAKARNPKARYLRLWWGKWSSGKGDAFDEDLIERALMPDACEHTEAKSGMVYLGGLDLSSSHDHSGLVVVGVDAMNDKIELAAMRAFKPEYNEALDVYEVDLMEIEKEVYTMHKRFNMRKIMYDPHEGRLMAMRLRKMGVVMDQMNFVGNNLSLMATTLKECLTSGRLVLYDDEDQRLRRDLGRFNIVEKQYGIKLEATRDVHGHADVGTALAIVLPSAVAYIRAGGLTAEDDLNWDFGDFDPNTEDLSEYPQELRDIIMDPTMGGDPDDDYRRMPVWDDDPGDPGFLPEF